MAGPDPYIYVDYGAGWVHDKGTNHLWTKDAGWMTDLSRDYQSAKNYCRNLIIGDKAEWYLPDMALLRNLHAHAIGLNMTLLETTPFENVLRTTYLTSDDWWDSLCCKYPQSGYWGMDMLTGEMQPINERDSVQSGVWCVHQGFE